MKVDIDQLFFKYCAYYPIIFLRRQNVPKFLKEMLKTQYLHKHDLEQIQLTKLQYLLKCACESVPNFSNSTAYQSNITKLKDLEKLPFMTKQQLVAEPQLFRSTKEHLFLTKKTTGGSTGEPLSIWKTSETMAMELAATWRGYTWAGLDIGDRQARFWGVPFARKDQLRAKLIDFIANRKRLSAFSFDDNKLREYSRVLRSFNPTYFYGYVSMLSEFAEYYKRNGLAPDFFLKSIITTSEVLSPYQRNLLEDVFSVKVFNEYGSAELGSIAHECERGSLHISAENLITEVLDGDRVCEVGEKGELVFTDLNNLATPLIRYRTGDFGVLSEKKCTCGRGLPIIKHVYGRAYDTLKNRQGKLFHGEFFMYIFEEAKRKGLGVKKFQVVQKSYDHLIIKIVSERVCEEELIKFIRVIIKKDFDSQVSIKFIIVNDISREASGKMRLIVGMP